MRGISMNRNILLGLAVAGLVVLAVAPGLVGSVLPLLLVAACPLMMLFMMRGGHGGHGGHCSTEPARTGRPAGQEVSRDEQLVELKAQLASLQDRQEALAREIAALEAATSPAVREAEAVARVAETRAQSDQEGQQRS